MFGFRKLGAVRSSFKRVWFGHTHADNTHKLTSKGKHIFQVGVWYTGMAHRDSSFHRQYTKRQVIIFQYCISKR